MSTTLILSLLLLTSVVTLIMVVINLVKVRKKARETVAVKLYDKLGEDHGLKLMLFSLYMRLIDDPFIKPFFVGIDINRIVLSQTAMFKYIIAGGGIPEHNVYEIHKHLPIRDFHFDKMLYHTKLTLMDFGTTEEEADKVISGLEKYRDQIVKEAL